MKAEIIAIGDEILMGQTLDTNSHWIARTLLDEGIAVHTVTVVPDEPDRMRELFQTAYRRSDVVLITGGLGPTHDDHTKEVLSKFFDLPIVFRNDILEQVRQVYEDKQMDFIETSRSQAEFPEGAIPMPNQYGTAPGIWVDREGTVFAAMPGVPGEMKPMMKNFVMPRLVKMVRGEVVLTRTIHTYHLPEAALYEKLDNRQQILEHAQLAFLPSYTGVKLRLTVETDSREEGQQRLDRAEELVREKLDEWIIGMGEEFSLEQGTGELLKRKGMKVAVAESCTGGLLGKMLTDTPGSSDWFERGFLTYSNEAKHELLGVPMELIEEHGAVSAEVAEAMAEGALDSSRAGAALSVTGIAGPGGGTEEKPVGLVFIGCALRGEETIHRRYVLGKERGPNRERSAAKALMMLIDRIGGPGEDDGQRRLL
jgi:nicotinamide-nucleotide amidase